MEDLPDAHHAFMLFRAHLSLDREENNPTAADVLNKLDERNLARVLKKYGEERKANQIARYLVEYRQMMGPVQTTRQLQDIVSKVYELVTPLTPHKVIITTRLP